MINSIRIEGFRTFQQFEMTDLALVNLIAGKNNVGKTSLLDAVYLITHSDPIKALSLVVGKRNSYIYKDRKPIGLQFNSIFWNYEANQKRFTIDSPSEKKMLHVFVKDEVEDNKQLNGFDSHETELVEQILSNHLRIELHRDVGGRGWKLPINSDRTVQLPFYTAILKSETSSARFVPTSGLEITEMRLLWDLIALTEAEDFVIETMKIVDPNIDRIRFLASGDDAYVKLLDQDKPVPLKAIGDGIQRVLGLAIAFATTNEGGCLLIDEVDTGLHYRIMTDVWKSLIKASEKRNIQLFTTTHSQDCVNSFSDAIQELEDYNVGAYFRLQRRGEQGEIIQSERYDGEVLNRAMEHGVEVR